MRLPRHWFGRLLLWWWRKRNRVTKAEFVWLPPGAQPPRLELVAPAELVAVFDNGAHYLAVFDVLPETWLVLRLTNRDARFDTVHRALLNVYEPNGRMEFRQLPPTLQRAVLHHFAKRFATRETA